MSLPDSLRTRRPRGGFLQGHDGVEIGTPGWAADWLLRQTNLGKRRVELRGNDPAIDDWLAELTYCATAWRAARASGPASANGSSVEAVPEVQRTSISTAPFSVGQAAAVIGVSTRAVRLAATQGRLRAHKIDGRWLIERDDARAFRDGRAAA